MPVHDWTRVDAGTFHNFHQLWTAAICNSLNSGQLPPDYFAMVEQRVPGPIPDVLRLKLSSEELDSSPNGSPSLAVATAPPRARVVWQSDADAYARKANRITIRHRHGNVVAIVEIVSPGNKTGKTKFRAMVEKLADFLVHDVHLLVIDLLPPTRHSRQGIARALWEEVGEEEPASIPGTPLTLASFDAGPPCVAYIEPISVGDPLPDMPLFLEPATYIPCPLEATYEATWNVFPGPLKKLFGSPATRRKKKA